MKSLYLESIKIPNVEPNVVTPAKGPVSSNVVGSVGTSVRSVFETVSLDKPRSVETIGQSSMNVVVDDDTVVESVHVSPPKDQPVSVVEIGSAIPQTDADMVLRVLNLMVVWSIDVLNVVEETDPNDLPLDQAIAQSVAERELVLYVMFRCDYYY
ncbi:hypothetical protein A2U01_0027722, partial [Trifolium medium]|nr:hypothetical protein [Trifolium medium]